MNQRITSHHYDLAGGEIGRITRTYLLHRWLPLGNLGGMTRMRQLLILLVLHRCGGVLFRMLIPHEDRLTRFYLRLRRKGTNG